MTKILVVDDERNIVNLIKIHLVMRGYEVITAFNGLEAVEKAKAEKPDLVTLDIKMPIMDGYQVIEALKRDPETATIPIIILSTYANEEKAKNMGAVDCLAKPLNEAALLSSIKVALNS